jgi:hypothetical protein
LLEQAGGRMWDLFREIIFFEIVAFSGQFAGRIRDQLTRKTKELDHEKLVTVFHGSSLGSSLAIFIYGDCGSPYSSYKSY